MAIKAIDMLKTVEDKQSVGKEQIEVYKCNLSEDKLRLILDNKGKIRETKMASFDINDDTEMISAVTVNGDRILDWIEFVDSNAKVVTLIEGKAIIKSSLNAIRFILDNNRKVSAMVLDGGIDSGFSYTLAVVNANGDIVASETGLVNNINRGMLLDNFIESEIKSKETVYEETGVIKTKNLEGKYIDTEDGRYRIVSIAGTIGVNPSNNYVYIVDKSNENKVCYRINRCKHLGDINKRFKGLYSLERDTAFKEGYIVDLRRGGKIVLNDLVDIQIVEGICIRGKRIGYNEYELYKFNDVTRELKRIRI